VQRAKSIDHEELGHFQARKIALFDMHKEQVMDIIKMSKAPYGV
jgi:hypothetical protein